jgi:hypothetical protein
MIGQQRITHQTSRGNNCFYSYIKLGLCALVILLLFGIQIFWSTGKEETDGVSRAELCKVLSFTYYNEEQWEQRLESEIPDMVTYEDLPYLYEQLG